MAISSLEDLRKKIREKEKQARTKIRRQSSAIINKESTEYFNYLYEELQDND